MFGLGFIGRLFGSEKAFESTIGLVDKVIDKSFYTDQEKAEAKQNAMDKKLDFTAEWMKNTQGQNLTRRFLALGIFFIWALFQLSTVSISAASIWLTSDKLASLGGLFSKQAEAMSGAMMLVLAFYFAAPYMGGIVHGALQKFSMVSSPSNIKVTK